MIVHLDSGEGWRRATGEVKRPASAIQLACDVRGIVFVVADNIMKISWQYRGGGVTLTAQHLMPCRVMAFPFHDLPSPFFPSSDCLVA